MEDVINRDTAEHSRYRVWMKDGCCFNVIASSESEAMMLAGHLAADSIKGVALDTTDKRKATTVDYVQLVARAGRL